MSETINISSPELRDKMLNSNFGKYNQITTPVINPIGLMPNMYNDAYVSELNKISLLEYYNNLNFKKTGDLEENVSVMAIRDKIPVKIDYPIKDISKYSYIEDNQYDIKNNNWLSLSDNSKIGSVLNKINDYKNDIGFDIFSSDIDRNASLPMRYIEYKSTDSDIVKIGMERLGQSLSNTIAQKIKSEVIQTNFLNKIISPIESLDELDFESVKGLNIPGITKSLSNSILPLYMYSEIKKSKTGGFSWLNEGEYSHTGVDGEIYTDKTKDNLINENIVTSNGNGLNLSKDSLLLKTQKLFENGKIQSIVSKLFSKDDETNETIQRGSNLWRKDGKTPIASWTVTNQYNKISSLARPFSDVDKEKIKKNLNRVRPNSDLTSSLSTYGVLQDDGFVKIAPYKTDEFGKNDIKKYMFSIENLAWKDSIDSIIEGTSQEGPNGGRIMWFPPYDITFNETVSVAINSETFIGRGEPIYTYSNTERNGTLNFKLIVDHPSIINYYKQDGFGLDGKKIEEDDYLRFFSGKDVIELKTKNEKIEALLEKEQEQPTNQIKTVKFKVFFPNNYSGINDGYKNTLMYLYEGIGCTLSGGSGYENTVGLSEFINEPCDGNYYYRVDSKQNLKGDQYKDLNCFGLNITKQEGGDFYTFREAYEQIELLSIETQNEEYDKRLIKSNYINSYINLTNLRIDVNDKNNEYEIAVENNQDVDEKLEDLDNTNNIYDLAYDEYISIETENNKINKQNNSSVFIIKDNKFNSNEEVESVNYIFESYKNQEETLFEKLNIMLSFKFQLYTTPSGSTEYNEILNNYNNSLLQYDNQKTIINNIKAEVSNELSKYLDNSVNSVQYNDLYKTLKDAKNITIMGSASKQGVINGNTILAENRMNIIEEWLKTHNNTANYIKKNIFKQQINGLTNIDSDKNTNSKTNKQDRFVYVEITTDGKFIDIENSSKSIGYQTQDETVTNNEIRIRRQKKSMYGYYFDENDNGNENSKLRNDESQFFEKITNNSDKEIIFKKLSDKIKYFTPAFHSTTPEGFNSRLTFLHQCTRQGPTNNANATNMSFGRPPICVLRIGDFYNTKVIFDSLNINYEPMVWDLNEEGIGVQPMIANISINFKFIGGSDLTGPIARLQNAITQNFFANTSVYDDRTDRIKNNNTRNSSDNAEYETLYNPFIYDTKK